MSLNPVAADNIPGDEGPPGRIPGERHLEELEDRYCVQRCAEAHDDQSQPECATVCSIGNKTGFHQVRVLYSERTMLTEEE